MSSAISAERRRMMLRSAMGPAIEAALSNAHVVEVMVNPDGALRVDILDWSREYESGEPTPRTEDGEAIDSAPLAAPVQEAPRAPAVPPYPPFEGDLP